MWFSGRVVSSCVRSLGTLSVGLRWRVLYHAFGIRVVSRGLWGLAHLFALPDSLGGLLFHFLRFLGGLLPT